VEQQSSRDVALRRRYLGWRYGMANVSYLLLMHGTLLGWLWYGRAVVPYPAFLALSVLACLIHQRMLSEWFHEATHWNLVPDRAWNDRLGDILIGSFNGVRVRANRPGHFRHHAAAEFFTPDDPDTCTAAAATRNELLRGILLVCGYNAIRNFMAAAGQTRHGAAANAGWLLWLLALHSAGLAFAFIHQHYEIYPVYFLTLLCLYPVANRFRLYAQHAGVVDDGGIALNGSPASRTFHSGLLEQLLLHSPMIMYHYEHHSRPSLPYRALAAISQPSNDPNRYGASGFRFVAAVLTGLR
jgi:hypothetical protein